MVKPPIGLKPKHVHEYHRINAITKAILDYYCVAKSVPREWVDELGQIVCDNNGGYVFKTNNTIK